MVWLDRAGKVIGTAAPPGNYLGVDVAPDGKGIAVHRHESTGGDVWLIDPARGPTRFTFDASQENSAPVWSPDGTRIAFASLRGGKWALYQKPSNGAGADELLLEPGGLTIPTGWSHDGRSLLYILYDSKTGADVWMLSLNGERKTTALVKTPAYDTHSQVSPDGRWLAYTSAETGRTEVYVAPFPTGVSKWLVSSNGGMQPRWRGDGRELFYSAFGTGGLQVMAADAGVSGSAFEAGAPKALFSGGRLPGPHATVTNYHSYGVSPDGQRFLTVRFADTATRSDPAAMPIAVVLNWAEGLRK